MGGGSGGGSSSSLLISSANSGSSSQSRPPGEVSILSAIHCRSIQCRYFYMLVLVRKTGFTKDIHFMQAYYDRWKNKAVSTSLPALDIPALFPLRYIAELSKLNIGAEL